MVVYKGKICYNDFIEDEINELPDGVNWKLKFSWIAPSVHDTGNSIHGAIARNYGGNQFMTTELSISCFL